jgi:hypothetical protein
MKIAYIDSCIRCPHFDNEYYDYTHLCALLDRAIDDYVIPDDCPLEDKGDK